MILTKEQINRYMRHISILEISGQGQKKILDSSVILIGEDPRKAAPALYYLTASGVGQIYCRFSNTSNWDKLHNNLADLNSDVEIQLQNEKNIEKPEKKANARIIAGNPDFVRKTLHHIVGSESDEEYIPSIISIYNGWRGSVQTFTKRTDFSGFASEIARYVGYNSSAEGFCCSDNLSNSFSCLMAVIEHIKLVLSLGKPLTEALYHNLSTMEFAFVNNYADLLHRLSAPCEENKRFDALADSKVLIAGCGGLGSAAAIALAAAGVGKLGLADYDAVELSNLNRQIMHSTSRIGMPKVQSAEIFLKQINPDIRLETYNTRINKANVKDIIDSYDIVIGALDNLPTRYVLNDACYAMKKPLIEAGALDISGLATTIIPESGHCYRCIFPESIDNSLVPSCAEAGVLGPVPGVIGTIQAAEAVKILTGIGKTLKNKIVLVDFFDTDIYVAVHGKNMYCELCGNRVGGR